MRDIAGQVPSITIEPPEPRGTSSPRSSTTRTVTPGTATVAEPGFSAVTPGSGATMAAPDSDCHQVSTTGACPPPICSRNHTQASGLIASPTVPSRRMLLRSHRPPSPSGNQVMNVRMRVGAV